MKFNEFLIGNCIFEGLSLKGSYKYTPFQRLVAAQYAIAPNKQDEAIGLYRKLADKIKSQYKMLSRKYDFQAGTEDPYKSMKDMKNQIVSQKTKKPVVKIYADPPKAEDGVGHPAFSNDENVMLRGVHDIIAHLYGNHPFSARGEYGAYIRHLKTLPPDVAPILFTEIVAQTSYYYIYKEYAKQKAVILDDFDYFNVGKLSEKSKLNDFFINKGKELKPKEDFKWSNFEKSFPKLASTIQNQPLFNKYDWDKNENK